MKVKRDESKRVEDVGLGLFSMFFGGRIHDPSEESVVKFVKKGYIMERKKRSSLEREREVEEVSYE